MQVIIQERLSELTDLCVLKNVPRESCKSTRKLAAHMLNLAPHLLKVAPSLRPSLAPSLSSVPPPPLFSLRIGNDSLWRGQGWGLNGDGRVIEV